MRGLRKEILNTQSKNDMRRLGEDDVIAGAGSEALR